MGAIDGTHISAWVPSQLQISYRGRKSVCTQNVMAVCDFDMRFTFVNAGWEGTATWQTGRVNWVRVKKRVILNGYQNL